MGNVIKREDIKKYILNSLGSPIVDVELTDGQIGIAISNALEEYVSNASFERGYWTPTTPADNAAGIPLPSEVATVCGAVYQKPLELLAGMAGTSDIFSFAMGGGGFIGGLQAGGYSTGFLHAAGNLATFYEYVSNRNRTLALEITWRVIDNVLYFFPYPPIGSKIVIEYAKNVNHLYNELDDTISTSNAWAVYWLKRMSLAMCKGMLAQARGKYSVMTGATGESVTLNSADLAAQAEKEQEELRLQLAEKISHRQFWIA